MLYGSAYDLPTPWLITVEVKQKNNQSVELGRSYRVELQQHPTDRETIKIKKGADIPIGPDALRLCPWYADTLAHNCSKPNLPSLIGVTV
jgi:hypothetical protein